MMFLKHRYRLGYETLCREVADSISWSRFCRIPLGTTVPHPSTLGKITTRCGPEVVNLQGELIYPTQTTGGPTNESGIRVARDPELRPVKGRLDLDPVGDGWFVHLVAGPGVQGRCGGELPAWAAESVHVVDYDPSWAERAISFAAEVCELFAGWLSTDVLHVGSTSVPGLQAKPIIDLQAVSADPAGRWLVISPMAG